MIQIRSFASDFLFKFKPDVLLSTYNSNAVQIRSERGSINPNFFVEFNLKFCFQSFVRSFVSSNLRKKLGTKFRIRIRIRRRARSFELEGYINEEMNGPIGFPYSADHSSLKNHYA